MKTAGNRVLANGFPGAQVENREKNHTIGNMRSANTAKNLSHRCALWTSLAALLFLALTGPAGAEEPLRKARLMPLWSPQAQFAGYYMALDKGIYARHGIDMTILEGGPGRSAVRSLTSGEADFAVLWLATALQQHDSGLKLVNLAQVIQRSSLLLIARKASGIARPEDLQGKKVSLWDGELSLPVLAFLDMYRLRVQRIPQSYTVNLFLRGGIDATSAMWYNEYHTILNTGIDPDELQVFALHEHGVTFPEDGLYTLEHAYRDDPAFARAVARASLEGWRYAFAHPEETLTVVLDRMRRAGVPASRAHQRWMLERMRDLTRMDSGTLTDDDAGRLHPSAYLDAAAILRDHGVIREIPDHTTFTGGDDVHR